MTFLSDSLTASPTVLFEDEYLLVLHKPSGMPSAPIRESDQNTAAHWAMTYSPDIQKVQRPGIAASQAEREGGLLHRLDTGTSGVLVFAKTQAEMERLLPLWKTPAVEKVYRALVTLKGPDFEAPTDLSLPFRIDWPLAHHPKSKKRMITLKSEHAIESYQYRGAPQKALTWIDEVRALAHPDGLSAWDLTIRIQTGVLHQIRCHLNALNLPILGDPIYQGLPSQRLWLHAWRIQIPGNHEKALSFEAPLPDTWNRPSV